MAEIDSRFVVAIAQAFGRNYRGYVGPALAERFGGKLIMRPRGPAAITQYVLHHSDGGRTMADVWKWHVQGRGWDTVGYGLGIRADGSAEIAALPSHLTYGAGTVNNVKSYYIVAIGDYETNEPPAAQLDGIYRALCVCDDVLGSKIWRGHKEVGTAGGGSTNCPGRNLMPHLVVMRGQQYGAASPRPAHYP